MFTQEAVRALFYSLAAGLSTLLGALIVFFTKGKNERLLASSLGFASGVMISVTFLDLLPSADTLLQSAAGEQLGTVIGVGALIVGVLLGVAIDKFVPHQEFNKEAGERGHTDLFRVGIVSMIAIALHNFPEGIATFMAGFSDAGLGLSIAIAIAMHNIPEGITVAMPVYFATGSRTKAFGYTFLSGIAEPIGAFLAFLLLQNFINDLLLGCLFGAVSGIMLYIALEELIPSSRQYGHNNYALVAMFIGICVMPLTHLF